LDILNYVFAAIFTVEFILKATGFGIIKYFSSPWNCLDELIVSVKFSYFLVENKPAGIKSLETVNAEK